MEVDIDSINTDELTKELNRLKDAVAELDDGAGELKDGAKN